MSNYGVTITSFEDVFLKVGEDHTVTPHLTNGRHQSDRSYQPTFFSQALGICKRNLTYALSDFIALLLLSADIAVWWCWTISPPA